MASCLWNNLNMPVAMALLLLLMVGSGCVLGDNYNNGRDYNNRATRPGSYCENLSPQQFIEMDHVRTSCVCMALDGRWGVGQE